MSKNQKKKGKKIIIGIIIIAIIVVGAFVIFSPKEEKYNEETAKIGDITTYYNFSGSIEVINTQNEVSKENFTVSKIYVEKGDIVKEGDTILKTTAGTKIKASINGEITEIYVEEDDKVTTGTKLFDIIDYDNLQTTVKVDEYDLSSIEIGKEVEVTINALEKTIKGTIYEISKEAIVNNGVSYFTAKIKLEYNESLKVGMTTEIKVLHQNVNGVILIPMEAIQINSENRAYVEIIDENNVTTIRYIETGISDGISIEVKSGLNEGDTVLNSTITTSDQSSGFSGFGGDRNASE